MQSVLFFNIKMSRKVHCFIYIYICPPPSANFKNSMKNRVTQKCRIFVYNNVSQIVLLFSKCLAFFYIQKSWHFALRDVFIYKKLDTWQKVRQFVIRFYIEKSGTFALRDFSLNFWNLRRGGGIYWIKNDLLCVIFLYRKTMHFALRCFIQRAWHYALHFNIQKTIHFSFRLYVYNLRCSPDT